MATGTKDKKHDHSHKLNCVYLWACPDFYDSEKDKKMSLNRRWLSLIQGKSKVLLSHAVCIMQMVQHTAREDTIIITIEINRMEKHTVRTRYYCWIIQFPFCLKAAKHHNTVYCLSSISTTGFTIGMKLKKKQPPPLLHCNSKINYKRYSWNIYNSSTRTSKAFPGVQLILS